VSRLHVFDMDGTLLMGSACFEISRAVGVLDETLAIEEVWGKGEISDNEFWVRCLPLWDGISDQQIDNAFSSSPWLKGVKDVFADIQSRNESSVVISQSPQFFVERLREWGANFAYGALVTPGNSKGAEQLVTSEDKLQITDNLLSNLSLSHEDCVAYGDSISDLDLFKTLPNTVAINAKEQIRELAHVCYDGPSIWEGYIVGREILENQATESNVNN
jgi:phosphoserine phosphatase